MRVVSWNVRSLRDSSRGVAAVLRSLSPDVVLVQEAPRLLLWRTSRRLLARRSGLRVVTRGRAAGCLVLRAPSVRVVRSGVVLMPRRPGLHRRAVAYASLLVAGAPVVVASTHLDLSPEARLDSARRVRAALPAGPLVLGADVNEEPGGPAWLALSDGLVDLGAAPTFPAKDPHRRIDVLLTSPELTPTSLEVVASGLVSDHLPLLARVSSSLRR
jgi:endonuclease/exonuclease/phosphatase family metal-dependent hydrolase